MSVTSKDIARELGLSQPTVSRILSGDEKHRASEETRQRVWEAAREMGYRTNALASSLRRGRTDIIGLHTNHDYDARNEFFGHIIGGLQCACNGHGLDLLLHSALQKKPAREMLDRLRDGRVDGLILHSSGDDPLVAMLSESSLPVVSVADYHEGMSGVTCDDAMGMRLLVEHLWARGYRRFVYVAPQEHLLSVERRRDVFESQLQARGVSPIVTRIHFEEVAPALDDLLALVSSEKTVEKTVLCCWNDRTAYKLLRECAALGIEVPHAFGVTGFDGFVDDKMPGARLTTISCPWTEVAIYALKLLVELIEKRDENCAPREVSLPVWLIEGDTV